MNSVELKKKAQELGADLVGVAPKSRWAHLAKEKNPLSIMPECKSVIVLGRKILRGAFRGVEESTNLYSTYGFYGSNVMEFTFFPRITYNLSAYLEEHGIEAVPMTGGTPKGENVILGNENIAANVRLDDKEMAYYAGLGSMGKGGFFLTRKYGHRQRFALLLTDQEFDADPIDELDFCDNCDACITACPLNAYVLQEDNEAYKVDLKICAECQNGFKRNGESSGEDFDRLASSCGRACMVALEDKIEEEFHNNFRKRAVWQRDIHGNATVIPLEEKGR